MKKPAMILFDYGQTLINEAPFDGVTGTQAVLQYATQNKHRLTARQVQAEADAINRESGRFDPARSHLVTLEIPNHMFTAYLYRSLGITLSLSPEEVDRVFWDAASPGTPTPGIADFLDDLWSAGIRTGVISNISFCGKALEERIGRLLPDHHFEFILATSEYLYRKPHPRIFRLALEIAGLSPDQVWYIGDQYQCDVVGARNAGLFPVWYTGALRSPEEPQPGLLTIGDWAELRRMLEQAEKS